MYGLNAFSFALFVSLNLLAHGACRSSKRARAALLQCISLALLGIHLLRLVLSLLVGRSVQIPVEFSTAAYFIVPILLLSACRCGRSWAAYSGLSFRGFFFSSRIQYRRFSGDSR